MVQVYAVLREGGTSSGGAGHTVCADDVLDYTSTTNVLQVRLVTQTAQFLVRVERKAPPVLHHTPAGDIIQKYNTIQIKIYIAPNSLIKRDRGAGWSARW